MDAERALEIGEDVIDVLMRIVFGDDAEGLHRRAGIAGVGDTDRDNAGGSGEGRCGLAKAEAPVADEVRADLLMQDRRPLRHAGNGIDHRLQRLVRDLDRVERILGEIAVLCHRDRDGLADIAHALDGHRPVLGGDLQAGDHRRGQLGEVAPGDDRHHARQRGGSSDLDREDVGMGVRRAQDRGVQRARPGAEIVDKAPATGQQGGVLDALHGLTRPGNGFSLHQRSAPRRRSYGGASREDSVIGRPGSIPSSLATYRIVSNSKDWP